jgi:hypothetical protein
MLTFSHVIKNIITDKNKILYIWFYTLFAHYNKKGKKYVYPYLNFIFTIW